MQPLRTTHIQYRWNNTNVGRQVSIHFYEKQISHGYFKFNSSNWRRIEGQLKTNRAYVYCVVRSVVTFFTLQNTVSGLQIHLKQVHNQLISAFNYWPSFVFLVYTRMSKHTSKYETWIYNSILKLEI